MTIAPTNHLDSWGGTGDGLEEPYGCLLATQPSHLVPRRLLSSLRLPPPDGPLVLSEACWLDEDLPARWRSLVPASVHRDPWTLWVRAADTGVVAPYLLEEAVADWLSGQRPGAVVDRRLDRRHRDLLAAVGALGDRTTDSQVRSEWDDAVTAASQQLTTGFAVMGRPLHPFHLASLRARYRRLVRSNGLQLGDTQSPLRYVAHNEPVARFFHRQLAPVVSTIVGRTVTPSYVYLSAYQPGADLPRHTDREQCAYTLAMLVDCTPEPRSHSPWPLKLELPQESVAVYQAVGDALLYRGTELPHFRDPLPDGRSSTSLFFHYVDQSFEGPLD